MSSHEQIGFTRMLWKGFLPSWILLPMVSCIGWFGVKYVNHIETSVEMLQTSNMELVKDMSTLKAQHVIIMEDILEIKRYIDRSLSKK